MNMIQKIARKIVARSQIVKRCSIDEQNVLKAIITEQIFLNPFTYNFKGLKADVNDFATDVNNQLENININPINADQIKLQISDVDKKLIVLSYEIEQNINEQQKQLIRQHEWIVDNVSI